MKTFHAPTLTDECNVDDFALAHRDRLTADLWSSGALLFRGFRPPDATSFAVAVQVFAPELMGRNGEHEPIADHDRVYRPVDYDPKRLLLWHNENSFDQYWPRIIAFCCATPATSGGETTLVASETLLHHVDPALAREFANKGVRYVRRMGLGVGRSWQQVFQTDSRPGAEAACRAAGFEYCWLDEDVLETVCTRPALVRHPITGVDCWFNQAQHWHVSCLDPTVRAELEETFGVQGMPRECTFGDGSPIADDAMQHILEGYRAAEIAVQWTQGDMLIVDNIAVSHGRRPYAGTRSLLVAMGMQGAYFESESSRSVSIPQCTANQAGSCT